MTKMRIFFLLLTMFFLPPITIYAERGCCSSHGGVSYCGSNGYYICNDGSQSPSCMCDSLSSDYIEKSDISNTKSCDYSSYDTKIKELQEQINKKDDSIDNYNFWFFIVLIALFVYVFKYYQKPNK